MKSIKEVITDPAKRDAVIDDTALLIDDEVKKKKGISGAAIKAGYSVVRRLKKGRMIHKTLNNLIDDFIAALEPLHLTYREAGERGFDRYLAEREDDASERLLTVTDQRAEKVEKGIVTKTYYKLRPRAIEHVKAALPGLGLLVDEHTIDD